jgi:hypothetical protein
LASITKISKKAQIRFLRLSRCSKDDIVILAKAWKQQFNMALASNFVSRDLRHYGTIW